jgi:Mg/Co/Ni transporter MgtE
MLSRGELDRAVALLERLDLNVAADVFLGLPMEEQELLSRRIPTGFAAALAPAFPYFHTYVLLHTRTPDDLKEIVEKMKPAERLMFFDDLPEQSWQHLMDELSGPRRPVPHWRRSENGTGRPGP